MLTCALCCVFLLSAPFIVVVSDAMVSTGLAAVGYSYINIDDCWQVSRDATGRIMADPKAFPSGMAALAEYVHSKGLKFGLYSDAGEFTCQQRPGGLGHETMDAQTYAAWQGMLHCMPWPAQLGRAPLYLPILVAHRSLLLLYRFTCIGLLVSFTCIAIKFSRLPEIR